MEFSNVGLKLFFCTNNTESILNKYILLHNTYNQSYLIPMKGNKNKDNKSMTGSNINMCSIPTCFVPVCYVFKYNDIFLTTLHYTT